MAIITLDESRDGLAGFPDGYEPIARDDLGDTLAVDGKGKVWQFQHGTGDWSQKSPAFSSVAQLREYVEFQRELEGPDGEDLDALLDRKKRIEAFVKNQRGAPYTKLAASQALETLREEIEDRRFWKSRRGTGIAERQTLGQRCEQALREGGAPGRWMIRPHVEQPRALVAIGRFTAPWTEAKVQELLAPILGKKFELQCREVPPSW
jgi:hypothetical protein